MDAPSWWTPPWGSDNHSNPDAMWALLDRDGETWHQADGHITLADEAIMEPLEQQFGGQFRSRNRVRDLAEVFTNQREVDAILDQIPDAFAALDIKFLEPACGSGNFLVEILRRKLVLVSKHDCATQEQYEHRLLRAAASIYGIDISRENITEARARMAHVLLDHYQRDASTIEPTPGFLNAAALTLGDNIVLGDTLNSPDSIELCDWQPRPGGRFVRVWSYALVPEAERNLFWMERVQDTEPVHYAQLKNPKPPARRTEARK
jgi:SAM-dependent methyltransferase